MTFHVAAIALEVKFVTGYQLKRILIRSVIIRCAYTSRVGLYIYIYIYTSSNNSIGLTAYYMVII